MSPSNRFVSVDENRFFLLDFRRLCCCCFLYGFVKGLKGLGLIFDAGLCWFGLMIRLEFVTGFGVRERLV